MTNYTPVELAFDSVEPIDYEKDKAPIIFLHGLWAFKEYWYNIPNTVANATKRKAYVMDLRNHGDSEWSDEFNFDCTVDDLIHFMDKMECSKAVLIGHSIGGIAALKTALRWPERVEKLILEDADIRRPPRQMVDLSVFYLSLCQRAISQVPVGASEDEAKKFIVDYVRKLTSGLKIPKHIRKPEYSNFSLKRAPDGQFQFKVNTPAMIKALKNTESLMAEPNGIYEKPTLFIYAEFSPFEIGKNIPINKALFPNAKFVNIKNSTHTVHTDYPREFTEEVLKFLQEE
ncbi:abhydrolase domain-containing protein C22H12.03 [Trichonephila clavata]|uniref:sn-1-specific diacylglycerol lipase ABHD11 n=1 Tax=Trichonephila clavata TaxID=2740835 RepID=A0A8X6GSN6_TRICU|nr:abhydrolase domain-containing protein C22H12.03 [Trichonephila clavata]